MNWKYFTHYNFKMPELVYIVGLIVYDIKIKSDFNTIKETEIQNVLQPFHFQVWLSPVMFSPQQLDFLKGKGTIQEALINTYMSTSCSSLLQLPL